MLVLCLPYVVPALLQAALPSFLLRRPGKRPASSMSPLIAERPSGDLALVVGASGGPRIVSAVLQAVIRCERGLRPAQVADEVAPGTRASAGIWQRLHACRACALTHCLLSLTLQAAGPRG